MQQGRILKGIGGFYYVLPEDSSETVECKARGRFRMDGLTPMVGDRVLFETQREGHARIAELLPMLQETRTLATLTAHYYDTGYHKHEKYSL